MKLPFGAEQGKKSTPRASALFWLFGLLVCYQAAYQVYMSFVLWQDPSAVDPWCNGQAGSAQQCIEAQLFRGWQSERNDVLGQPESQDQLNDLLQYSSKPHSQSTESTTHAASAAAVTAQPEALQATTKSPAVDSRDAKEAPLDNSSGTPWSENLIAIQHGFEERMRKRQEKRHHAAHATIQEWQNMSSLSQDLKALHDRFGARLAERRAHTQEAQDEFKNLTAWAKDVEKKLTPGSPTAQAASASKEDDLTPWSRELTSLQHRMEARMEAHDKAHHEIDVLDARIEAQKKELNLGDHHSHAHTLLEQIAAVGKEMCADAKHRQDPKCKQFLKPDSAASTSTAPHRHLRHSKQWNSLDEAEARLNSELHDLADKHTVWEKSFLAKVSDTMDEFCDDPMHVSSKTCIEFRQEHPHHSEAEEIASKKQAWHSRFATKIANVGHDLCSNPMRRDYSICKKILGEEQAASSLSQDATQASKGADQENAKNSEDAEKPTAANKTSPHERFDLQWSAVTNWETKTSKGLRGARLRRGEESIVTIDQAKASKMRISGHWGGRVPSAACIALVPKGDAAKVWLEYFIDNFRLQHYEGSHQLVLVYHHGDQEVAELVHKYVDGTYIKSAEARGEEYPSAAAFRFGAWIARDADVIARWDFSAWHHPHRLSMQVRALALAGRPAGLLNQWRVLEKQGGNTTERTEQDGERWDSSLVGEAAWMRKHWYPYMKEERAEFDAHSDRDVVKLDSPGLEVFDEAARW
jgi:hypothetical protein